MFVLRIAACHLGEKKCLWLIHQDGIKKPCAEDARLFFLRIREVLKSSQFLLVKTCPCQPRLSLNQLIF